MYYTIKVQQTATSETRDLHSVYGLIPTSRPVITPPSPILKFEEIPGGSGSLDLSQVLSSEMMYFDRTGSLEFMFAPNTTPSPSYTNWEEAYSSLVEFLSIGRVKIWTSANPWGEPSYSSFYYEGRMTVNEWKTDKTWEKVTLDYRLDPFKYEDSDYVSDTYTIPYNSSVESNSLEISHVTVPTITLSKSMTATYNGRDYILPAGDSRIIPVNASSHTIIFKNNISSGSGTAKITFRRKFL